METYDKRVAEIEQQRRKLDELKEKIASHNDEIKEKEQQWLTPLKQNVEVVDESFRRLCQNTGIIGQVSLNAQNVQNVVPGMPLV